MASVEPLQQVASILTCPRFDAPWADQTGSTSSPHMRIMRYGSCPLKPAVYVVVADLRMPIHLLSIVDAVERVRGRLRRGPVARERAAGGECRLRQQRYALAPTSIPTV